MIVLLKPGPEKTAVDEYDRRTVCHRGTMADAKIVRNNGQQVSLSPVMAINPANRLAIA